MKLSSLTLYTALAFSTIGCGGKKDACTTTMTKLADGERAEAEKLMEKLTPEERKSMDGVMDKAIAESAKHTAENIKACQDGKWSDAVLSCLNEAKTKADRGPCLDKLTPDQLKAIKSPAHEDKPDDTAKPAAAEIPQECQDYKAAIESMMKCDKLAAARDGMKQGFDAMSKSWSSVGGMSDDAKKAMIETCTQGTEAIKGAMTDSGC